MQDKLQIFDFYFGPHYTNYRESDYYLSLSRLLILLAAKTTFSTFMITKANTPSSTYLFPDDKSNFTELFTVINLYKNPD